MMTTIKNHIAEKLRDAIRRAEAREHANELDMLRARMKRIGSGVTFNGRMRISSPEHIELGKNVHIGDNAFIRAEAGLRIGDNTHISRNLVLYTINHDSHGTRLPYDEGFVKKPVEIGRNVWIGMNVCIAPGSVIGDGAIVGMGTVIAGEVPSLSIVAGQKWRIIGERDAAHYQQLEAEGLYGGPDGKPF